MSPPGFARGLGRLERNLAFGHGSPSRTFLRAQQVDRNPVGHHRNVAGQAVLTTPCPEPRIVVLKQPQKDGLPAVVAILLTDPEPPKNSDHNRPISIDELFDRTRLAGDDSFNEQAFVKSSSSVKDRDCNSQSRV